jgi:hypothetical protein
MDNFYERFYYNSGYWADWISRNDLAIAFVIGAVIMIALVASEITFIFLGLTRVRKPMVQDLRDTRVKFIVGNILTEGVEEYRYRNKLSDKECADIYFKMGRAFGLTDVLPQKKQPAKLPHGKVQLLKMQIKQRLAAQGISTTTNVVKMQPPKKLGSMLKR